MKILVFEDSGYKNLFPLNMLRASFDIRCGANTVLDRINNILNGKYEITLQCRKILVPTLKQIYKYKINSISSDEYLLLNGRIIFTEEFLKKLISKKEKNCYYQINDTIVASFITKEIYEKIINQISSNDFFSEDFFTGARLKRYELKDNGSFKIINYPWDVIDYILKDALKVDLEIFLKSNNRFKRIKAAENFIEHKKIFVSKDTVIYPLTVIDASAGNVIIDSGTKIEPFTFIKGPVYIGKNCLLKSGSRIYGPTVIGDYSKAAGEIAESVFHSYVNKQHDGFTGHSYICPFVNLGADTVTSDLKNNYSEIRMKNINDEVNTGMKFLGSIIGDHTKTSINSMLNSGTTTGIFVNIFGNGFPDKFIPSFSWVNAGKSIEKYNFERALETAEAVMNRRGLKLNNEYKELVKSYY